MKTSMRELYHQEGKSVLCETESQKQSMSEKVITGKGRGAQEDKAASIV